MRFLYMASWWSVLYNGDDDFNALIEIVMDNKDIWPEHYDFFDRCWVKK